MIKFDRSQIQWCVSWWPVPPEHDVGTAAELHREMCAGPVLFGRTVQAIGRRQDCDDVCFISARPSLSLPSCTSPTQERRGRSGRRLCFSIRWRDGLSGV